MATRPEESSDSPIPEVPSSLLGRTGARVRTSAGIELIGELRDQQKGWLRVHGSMSGLTTTGTRDWWVPIAIIVAVTVDGAD